MGNIESREKPNRQFICTGMEGELVMRRLIALLMGFAMILTLNICAEEMPLQLQNINEGLEQSNTTNYFNEEMDDARGRAIEYLDRNIEWVRESMNNNPERVEDTLIWYMARPVGDDPRVLDLCIEILENSKNSESKLSAVRAIGIIIGWHLRRSASPDKEKELRIAKVLEKAAKQKCGDLRIRIHATIALSGLGKGYEAKAKKCYSGILKTGLQAQDIDLEKYLIVVQKMLEFEDVGHKEVLLAFIKKYDLLNYLETQIKNEKNGGSKAYKEMLLVMVRKFLSGVGDRVITARGVLVCGTSSIL